MLTHRSLPLNTIIAYGTEKVKLILSGIHQSSGQFRRFSSSRGMSAHDYGLFDSLGGKIRLGVVGVTQGSKAKGPTALGERVAL